MTLRNPRLDDHIERYVRAPTSWWYRPCLRAWGRERPLAYLCSGQQTPGAIKQAPLIRAHRVGEKKT